MTLRHLQYNWREILGRSWDRIFSERQILLRSEGRVSVTWFSRRAQTAILVMFMVVTGWTVFSTVSYIFHEEVVASRDNQITHARIAYRSLLNEIGEYRKKFGALTKELEENRGVMLGLVGRNATLQENLRYVEGRLNSTEKDRARVLATRTKVKRQLNEVHNDIQALSTRNLALRDNLGTIETDLQTALLERNKALFDSTRMRRHITELESRLDDLQESEMGTVQRLSDRTISQIDTLEKVVELTGLNVDHLLAADNKSAHRGQGGPFIEVTPDVLPAGRLKAGLTNLESRLQRSESLQAVMSKLPLMAPLNSYYVTSRYGKRRDPINKRWGAHYGLDLGSPFKAPVYVTAPGVVTFVGWKGKYGKFIEVDHGAGIKTRYGHLHKTFVKKGQKLKYREKIGLLGSTGRSTGAHLHYEVLFKNKARNPMKFLKAGRYVFQK